LLDEVCSEMYEEGFVYVEGNKGGFECRKVDGCWEYNLRLGDEK